MEGTSADRVRFSAFYGVIGGFFAIVLIVGLCLWAVARSHPSGSEPQRQVYSRDEFKSRVMGKTEEEVYQVLGAPDFTSQDSETRYWHYRKCTHDPVSKEADMDAQLVFREGKVASVNY